MGRIMITAFAAAIAAHTMLSAAEIAPFPDDARVAFFGDRVEYAQLLHDASEIEVRKRSGELNIGGGHKARVADDAWEFALPVVKPDVEIPVIEVFLKD